MQDKFANQHILGKHGARIQIKPFAQIMQELQAGIDPKIALGPLKGHYKIITTMYFPMREIVLQPHAAVECG
jgi:hypothetical protein